MSLSAETMDSLRQYIRIRIAMGFDEAASIIENAVEIYALEEGDAATAAAAALYHEVSAAHEAGQPSWPAVTDCDRLDAAFERLNDLGIMARHHWTCCGNCGRAEMPDEFERLGGEWLGTPIIGYTFYHQQDSEAAAEGDGVCLGYGSTEPAESESAYEAQSLRIARMVRDVLHEHGLRVEWDGSYSKRLSVEMDWKRRSRPARFCGE